MLQLREDESYTQRRAAKDGPRGPEGTIEGLGRWDRLRDEQNRKGMIVHIVRVVLEVGTCDGE